MRVRFWVMFIGTLLLVFGLVGVINEVFNLNIDIPWWSLIAIIIAIWILSHAFKKG